MSTLTHTIIGLLAETPLHAGGGSADEVIDLPIQREAHTDWPCIYGSSLKGALRSHADNCRVDPDFLATAFGPATDRASEHAGALLVGDARLLLLPVRSLTGHYKQVTCPALLQRFLTDRARAGVSNGGLECPEVSGSEIVLVSGCQEKTIYLEEFRFEPSVHNKPESWLERLGELIASVPGLTKQYQVEQLGEKLAIVSDDTFRHLCRSSLPVVPHIRIDSETKTVHPGALWYEENLSPDTLMYSVIASHSSRNPAVKLSSSEILAQLQNELFAKPYLQVGANETTGMGWCRVSFVGAREDG